MNIPTPTDALDRALSAAERADAWIDATALRVWLWLRRLVLRAVSRRAVVVWWHDDGTIEIENRTDWAVGIDEHPGVDRASITLWRRPDDG